MPFMRKPASAPVRRRNDLVWRVEDGGIRLMALQSPDGWSIRRGGELDITEKP